MTMISIMTISDLAPVSLVAPGVKALEEVGAGMTTLTTIGTMMTIGVVKLQRHLVPVEGGMTMATMILMTIGMTMIAMIMTMIGKLRTVVEADGADRWLIGGPICGIKR